MVFGFRTNILRVLCLTTDSGSYGYHPGRPTLSSKENEIDQVLYAERAGDSGGKMELDGGRCGRAHFHVQKAKLPKLAFP